MMGLSYHLIQGLSICFNFTNNLSAVDKVHCNEKAPFRRIAIKPVGNIKHDLQ